MSYAASAPLQVALFARLSNDPELIALGASIHDALPAGTLPSLAIVLGPEWARDASDKTARALKVDFQVSVFSSAAGFLSAKEAAGAVCIRLTAPGWGLGQGHLVGIWFLTAKARKENSNGHRRIDLTFRALIEDI